MHAHGITDKQKDWQIVYLLPAGRLRGQEKSSSGLRAPPRSPHQAFLFQFKPQRKKKINLEMLVDLFGSPSSSERRVVPPSDDRGGGDKEHNDN